VEASSWRIVCRKSEARLLKTNWVELNMNKRIFSVVTAIALGMTAAAAPSLAETKVPTEGKGAKPGWPDWYLQGSPTDPEGPIPLSALTGRGELGTGSYARGVLGDQFRGFGAGRAPAPGGAGAGTPARGAARGAAGESFGTGCKHSPICLFDGTIMGGVPDGIQRVVWRANMGYTFAYPIKLPEGSGNVAAASVDSHDNIWVYQRNRGTTPALMKFSPDYKLLVAVDPSLTDAAPFNAHDAKVDSEDNIWVADQSGAIVQKFSPDGQLLLTIGTKGHRGDWDEAQGQRLLWEPVAIDFGPNGDIYIFEGHGDESPNDAQSDDPTNTVGVARVIRLDKTGKFISQWYGSVPGPGKFYMGHGGAVDPVTGDVWVGDRQNYRIVIFNADGYFLRTISMRNLTSALFFDKRKGPGFGTPWLADGQDGQVLKLDRKGNVVGAIGSRKSTAPNHFSEAAFMGINSKGRIYVGDSQVPRVTELIPPTKSH
jgi:hypothetical protein